MQLDNKREPLVQMLREMEARLSYFAGSILGRDNSELQESFCSAAKAVEDLIAQVKASGSNGRSNPAFSGSATIESRR